MEYANEFGSIINEFSKLLVEAEFLFTNREALYYDIAQSMIDKVDDLQPKFYNWRQAKLDLLTRKREELSDKQQEFFDQFLAYERLSTSAVLEDFARVNFIANQVSTDDVLENLNLNSIKYSQTIINKLHTLGLQRSIVLGALERLRNRIDVAN